MKVLFIPTDHQVCWNRWWILLQFCWNQSSKKVLKVKIMSIILNIYKSVLFSQCSVIAFCKTVCTRWKVSCVQDWMQVLFNSTLYLAELFVIFILLRIWQNCVFWWFFTNEDTLWCLSNIIRNLNLISVQSWTYLGKITLALVVYDLHR